MEPHSRDTVTTARTGIWFRSNQNTSVKQGITGSRQHLTWAEGTAAGALLLTVMILQGFLCSPACTQELPRQEKAPGKLERITSSLANSTPQQHITARDTISSMRSQFPGLNTLCSKYILSAFLDERGGREPQSCLHGHKVGGINQPTQKAHLISTNSYFLTGPS